MGGAPDNEIAAYARKHLRAIVTRDFDFADIRNYPPADYQGIAILQLQDDATAAQVLELLTVFASREDLLGSLPGSLAIVEHSRVRFRR